MLFEFDVIKVEIFNVPYKEQRRQRFPAKRGSIGEGMTFLGDFTVLQMSFGSIRKFKGAVPQGNVFHIKVFHTADIASLNTRVVKMDIFKQYIAEVTWFTAAAGFTQTAPFAVAPAHINRCTGTVNFDIADRNIIDESSVHSTDTQCGT